MRAEAAAGGDAGHQSTHQRLSVGRHDGRQTSAGHVRRRRSRRTAAGTATAVAATAACGSTGHNATAAGAAATAVAATRRLELGDAVHGGLLRGAAVACRSVMASGGTAASHRHSVVVVFRRRRAQRWRRATGLECFRKLHNFQSRNAPQTQMNDAK